MKDMSITMEPDGWMGQTGGYAKDMTLRQYIAIQAMKGALCDPDLAMTKQELSFWAFEMADAMLQAGND